MLTKEQVLAIFEDAGVLQTGHFLLTSGRHSDKYLQCAKIFRNSKYSEPLCKELAARFAGEQIDVVIGPAIGAIQMAYEVGRQIGCENFFAEREEGEMTFRRGFAIKPGQKVLVVEDVITTGGSVKEIVALAKSAGADIRGVGCIVDRTGGKADFGIPRFESVISLNVASYEANDCPICKAGDIPLIKPGSKKLPGVK